MTRPLLSILIPTIPGRERSLARLMDQLIGQGANSVFGSRCEMNIDCGPGTTGEKRNRMLTQAAGEYVCFVDDDDLIADDYVARVLKACERGLDCCSLEGMIHFDHKPSRRFRNSIDYNTWTENAEGFVRTPNHLNAVKRKLAMETGFPHKTVGEDFDYANRLYPLLRTEANIPGGPLYHYFSEPKVRARAAGLKFLIKWPTRGRYERFRKNLCRHVEALSTRNQARFVFSVDADDPDAAKVSQLQEALPALFSVQVGAAGRGKIGAINADIPKDDWDVLVLLADDMSPAEKNWDERILLDMMRTFPHLDGVLDYADGFRGEPADPEEVSCITMPVMGRALYDRQGYIYHPEYTSLWCDNELADVAKKRGKAKHLPRVIIKHDWVGQKPDALAAHNESFYAQDKAIYERRKAAGFPRGSSLVYSQNDEENHILREVGAAPGRLLDIGAWSGEALSNSRRLLEMGWRGVLVEPAPGPFEALLKLYGSNPRVQLVNTALAGSPGWAQFHDSGGDAVSTLSDAHAAVWSGAGIQWRPYLLRTSTPEQLFQQVGWDFDFINLDVEGVNLEVFRAIDWSTLASQGLRLVCVEHEGNQPFMQAELAALGFEVIAENAENILLARR